ncbi:hypothetical protein Dfri01_66990 [Dyadobacter frigoris]|uniref:hypothetical protein n=1 Tax=Dyadobacter frigoris TaxID=2576211 RepID=UPI0024A56650|nr:hypothetical protein [Dyadobacter frigoris]GLU57238.1 hypothetical protein Dfri01_66990 [Dyadobacter frigoris]
MNRYPDLSNTAKARILCQLFAAQIPAVLEFIAKESAALLENPAAFKYWHDERLFSFERLLSLAKEVKSCISQGRRKDPTSLFISLFDGYRACYTAQLLARYTLENEPPRERFAIAVRLIFMV